MNIMFIFGIILMISIFGSFILAGVAIWALATKKDTMPKWGKIILWLFIILAIIILIVGIISVMAFLGKFIIK